LKKPGQWAVGLCEAPSWIGQQGRRPKQSSAGRPDSQNESVFAIKAGPVCEAPSLRRAFLLGSKVS